MSQYLPVLALLVLGFIFGFVSLMASKLLAPRRATQEKIAPYECGIIPGREPPQRFPVRFYLVAMMFVIFDIEIIFLYPYAVTHQALGRFGLIAILIFSALVFESFVYLISKGALDWGPLNAHAPLSTSASETAGVGMSDPRRTSASTVRRVGAEGRLPPRAATAIPEPSMADLEASLVGTGPPSGGTH
ncbi:MAG: NAD(P)H-quinone oxidoreductase subunit 3 [Acidimicrobiales bacterium]|nr:NAD(P)H-quinone oxidoreductase subunit 3 [Acidimicrobiales bacterium]